MQSNYALIYGTKSSKTKAKSQALKQLTALKILHILDHLARPQKNGLYRLKNKRHFDRKNVWQFIVGCQVARTIDARAGKH